VHPPLTKKRHTYAMADNMTDLNDDNDTIGDCGVCGNRLQVGANHAYTACRHLFCIPCLLKWHKANPNATCPMCRTPFYEDDEDDEDDDEDDSADLADLAEEDEETSRIVEEMDFNLDEEIMHDHMLEVIEHCAMNHCRTNPGRTYMGRINLHLVPNEDGSNYRYERIDVGTPHPNSHYIVELTDTARAFRYRFGRIEEIITHHLYHDVKWYAFRERIDRIDEEQAQIITEWSDEIQHIAIDNVKVLRQYLPKIRMQA
jgi:hypothetical protein